MPTFQDLLASPHDEDLFEYFATSQLARIDAESGEVERIGPAGLITDAEASPDEKYVLVSTVRRPFSYRVPVSCTSRGRPRSGTRAAGRSPRLPTCRSPTTSPARACPPAAEVDWQPLHDARLLWTEALDGGDPRAKGSAPRQGDGPRPHRSPTPPAEVMKVAASVHGLRLAAGEGPARWSTEFDRDRRWRTTALVDLAKPEDSRKVLFDLSVNDAYNDPGPPDDGHATRRRDDDPPGRRFDLSDRQGASPEGSRPFLDKMDLKTGEKTRLFRCASRLRDRRSASSAIRVPTS